MADVREIMLVHLVDHATPKLHHKLFDSRPGHLQDLNIGACGLSSLVLGVNGWVQGSRSRAINAAFTAKVAAWPKVQADHP